MLDTQRADRLSCYGYPRKTSPSLDSFACESTLFAHAVSPAQWTVPSHASMFTGLYPSEHSMLQMDSMMPEGITVLAERLRQAGYFTCGFSNNPLVGVLNNGLQRGFTRFINYGGLLTPRSNLETKCLNSHPGRAHMSSLTKLLAHVQNKLANSQSLRNVFFSSMVFPLWQTALLVRGNMKGDTRQTLQIASHLLIDRPGLKSNQPIFCFINLMGAHVPYYPPRSALKRFAPHLLDTPVVQLYLWRFNTRLYQQLGPQVDQFQNGLQALINTLYDAEVWTQDRALGNFFNCLRAANRYNQTLFIVTADHGELLGEKNLLGHAFSIHEPLVHVPLLIRDIEGELQAGDIVSQTVSTRRIFHTILTVAGLSTPQEERLSLIRNGAEYDAEDIVISEAEPLYSAVKMVERSRPGILRALGYDQPERAIYQNPHKLIMKANRTNGLYSIRDDPNEDNNLLDQLPGKKEKLIQLFEEFLQHRSTIFWPCTFLTDSQEVVSVRLKSMGYME